MPSAVTQALSVQATTTTTQSAAGGTGNGTSIALAASTEDVSILVSGGVATIVVECSFDSGSTWETVAVTTIASGAVGGTITSALGAARYLVWPPAGATNLRTRISAFVSGAITAVCIERRRP